MILGLGIDIVSVERIEKMLERHGERVLKRLYTKTEQAYCQAMPHPAFHFAARFAAKEAFVKALGIGFTGGMRWNEIGIVNDKRGKPELILQGEADKAREKLGAARALVSLTHDPTHAGAVVILEK